MSANPNKPKGISGFWKELKRRKVLRSLAIYAGTAFLILEAATIIFPRWGLPDRSIDLVLWLLILGAVINIFVAWVFDITPQGLQKTKPIEELAESEKSPVSKGWKAATYLSLVVIVALIVLNVFSSGNVLKAGDVQSLVILPFDNYTGDDGLEYFVSGMHSSLIGDMGRLSGLRVICKTSSDMYEEADMSASEIASELNVDAVVETSVMCLGDTICVQFRLVSTSGDEEQLWIADYKEEKSQILNLYNQVTKQIANEVMIELTDNEEMLLARKQTVDKDAYDAYLRSREYWGGDLSKESLYKALEYLTEAVEKDPEFAPPYAGLAQVWAGMAQMGFVPGVEAFPKIFENINRALELDPNLPDVHFTSGIIAVWVEWNWEKGEKEFLQAIANNPSDAMSRMYYAHLLTLLNRIDEAHTQGQLAADLDPLNPLIQALYAVVLVDVSGWEAAYDQIQKAIALDPDNHFSTSILDIYAYRSKDYSKAIEAIEDLFPIEQETVRSIKNTYRERGIDLAYEEIMAQLELIAHENLFSPFDMASRYSMINQYDKAMNWIEIAFESHDQGMPYINTGLCGFDSIYKDPRYITLVEKLNLKIPTE